MNPRLNGKGMRKSNPDFTRLQAAISRERLPDRLPIAEMSVDFEVMEAFLGRPIKDLDTYVNFWKGAGYDYVILQVRGQPLFDSFQIKITEVTALPEYQRTVSTFSGGIGDKESFEAYPWIGPEDVYYKDIDLIEKHLSEGMMLVVNVGPIFSGLWRCMGLDNFSLACIENPQLIKDIVEKMGGLTVKIVQNLVQRDYVGAIWLGDDIAYTNALMASPRVLREYIFPFYSQIGYLCRRHEKLFIFHSDGKLGEVFEDLISCGIQAIHPNEPLSVDITQAKKQYGNRVALIGNVDVDLLARGTIQEVMEATKILIHHVAPGGGFVLGSGNSISKYVPLDNYRAMLHTVREYGSVY